MISVSRMNGDSGSAAKYYTSEADYYTKDDAEPGVWIGEGAALLGLEGAVSHDDLKDTLDGKINSNFKTSWDKETASEKEKDENQTSNPQRKVADKSQGKDPSNLATNDTDKAKAGQQTPSEKMAKEDAKDIRKDRQNGWDFTSSVPKSVSIMMLVAGDDRLKEAFIASDRVGMAYLEKYAAVRERTPDGSIKHKATGNLVQSAHFEETSRDLDPAAHIHHPTMNMTYDKDRKSFYALESLHLYRARETSDRVMTADLAIRVQGLGYEIETDQRTGSFEIIGVPTETKDLLSKRTNTIKEFVASQGKSGAEAEKNAQMITRAAKKQAFKVGLRGLWRSEIGEKVYQDLQNLKSHALRNERTVEVQSKDVKAALHYGHDVAHGKEAVVDEYKIISASLKQGIGKVSPLKLFKQIERDTKAEKIIATTVLSSDEKILHGKTTRRIVMDEKTYLKNAEQGRGKARPAMGAAKAKMTLRQYQFETQGKKVALDKEQVSAGTKILSTKDRFVFIQGVAGAGKSQLIDAVVKAAPRRQHYAVAPTNKALVELQEKTKIEGTSLRGLVLTRGRSVKRNAIVYVDEASMADTSSFKDLTDIAKERKFQVAIIGDKRQLPAIQAGRPHEDALKQKLDTAELKTSRRQIHGSQAEAVAKAVAVVQDMQEEKLKPVSERRPEIMAHQDTQLLLYAVGRNVTEIQGRGKNNIPSQSESRNQVADAAALEYVNDKDPNKGGVLVFDNETRGIINSKVRDALKARGHVKGSDTPALVLQPKKDEKANLTQTFGYKKGDIAEFHRQLPNVKMGKGDRAVVISVSQKNKTVTFQIIKGVDAKQNLILGKTFLHRPETFQESPLSLFTSAEKNIAAGDKIIFTQKTGDAANAVQAKVEDVKDRIAHVTLDNGKEARVDLDKSPHWDHAYGITIHRAQGATMNTSRVVLFSFDSQNASSALFNSAVTRARDNVKLFTDNKIRVLAAVKENSGRKTSALGAVPDHTIKSNTEHWLHNIKMKAQESLSKLNGPTDIAVRAKQDLQYPPRDFGKKESFSEIMARVHAKRDLEKAQRLQKEQAKQQGNISVKERDVKHDPLADKRAKPFKDPRALEILRNAATDKELQYALKSPAEKQADDIKTTQKTQKHRQSEAQKVASAARHNKAASKDDGPDL